MRSSFFRPATQLCQCLAKLARALLVLGSILGACPLHAGTPFERLTDELTVLLKDSRIPGAAIAVQSPTEDKSGLWYYGLADREAGRAVDSHTLFRYGSVSKNVTSLIALRLVAAGRLALDERINSGLSDWRIENPWAATTPVRLVHLLEHTSGLDGSSYAEYAKDVLDLEPQGYLKWLGTPTLRWPPGRFYSYANPGHTIAAAYMSARTGLTFDQLAEQEVFSPLGMRNSSFLSRTRAPERLARSYSTSGAPLDAWLMPIRPSGALSGTLEDGIALLRMYLHRGRDPTGMTYLPRSLLERMERAETSAAARAGLSASSYGLGNFAFVVDSQLWRGHWGKTEGFRTHLGYQPAAGHGFLVLLNGTDERAAAAIRQELSRFLTAEADAPAAAGPVGSRQADLESSVPAPAGDYINMSHEMALRQWLFKALDQRRIEQNGEALEVSAIGLRGSGSRRFLPVGNGSYRPESLPQATSASVQLDGTHYWIDGASYRRVPAFVASFWRWLPLAAGMAMIATPFVFWRGRGRGGQRLAPRLLLASGASMAVTAGLFTLYGLTADSDRLQALGTLSAVSLCLLITSACAILMPVVTLIAGLASGPARWRERPATFLAEMICLLPMLSLAFVWWRSGWLPLVLWQP